MDLATYHIQLKGIVQGVGMRPAIHRFALHRNLTGYVCNATDGVHIELNCLKIDAALLRSQLLEAIPKNARVTESTMEEVPFKKYDSFVIRESTSRQEADLSLAPDYGLCENCRQELHDTDNRRYRYPFITCTHCGPRFSIQESLPYDRGHTTMEAFTMCPECQTEYAVAGDRRFYSQTNSCETCGVHYTAFNEKGIEVARGNEDSLSMAVTYLRQGKIVALKAIGGFLLLCDAANLQTIKQLREKKNRPTKPFAVLCRDLSQLGELVTVPDEAANLLSSPAAPIVVLPQRPGAAQLIATGMIAPGLHTLGVMLPYGPMLEILMSDFKRPVIATSANQGSASLQYQNEEALGHLSGMADLTLTHNRDILSPQDDSVILIPPKTLSPIILRRSRGLSPSLPGHTVPDTGAVLATGALLKSTFTLAHHGNLYTSQYLGNTEDYDTTLRYRHTVDHYLSLTGAKPKSILTDLHPGYFSSHYGHEYAMTHKIPLYRVPHHKAHFAAVLGENDLMYSKDPVLGIIWDGLGLGTDGNIWGGEFFIFQDQTMERVAYFEYFTLLLADKMAREPRLSALSIATPNTETLALLRNKFSADEWKIYPRLLEKEGTLQTDSCGRLFDAVASLLGICDIQHFEGEAALLLEDRARTYFSLHGYQMNEWYFDQAGLGTCISVKSLMQDITRDIHAGKKPDFIAAKFHDSLVRLMGNFAREKQIHRIAFSGGVFQN
ncbi:MAG: carbamoyltransferase HypF, partial [Bacteroidota bacterium]|nr:carbamoyltransferase HypF [Bacteroidota bacterium]